MRTLISSLVLSLVAITSLANANVNAPVGFNNIEDSSVKTVFAKNINTQVVNLEGYIIKSKGIDTYEFKDTNGDKIELSLSESALNNIDRGSLVKLEAEVKKDFVKTSLVGMSVSNI